MDKLAQDVIEVKYPMSRASRVMNSSPKKSIPTTQEEGPEPDPPPRNSRHRGRHEMASVMPSSARGSFPTRPEACSPVTRIVTNILLSRRFDLGIGIVIVMNSASIGMEQSLELDQSPSAYRYLSILKAFENIFLSIYIIELGARFWAFGVRCLRDPSIRFDCLLVVLGVTTNWILEPIWGRVDELGPAMVLRTMRLLRLARTVRLLINFRELWMLVRGFYHSINTMFYTLVLLFIALYVFSAIGIELITNSTLNRGPNADPGFQQHVNEYFKTLPVTMLSLIQFISMDNAVLIYRPLLLKEPSLVIYFVGIILSLSTVLMNLVTAVLVNSALEQTNQDKEALKAYKEAERKKLVKELRKIFARLDLDGSGELTREEISTISDEDMTEIDDLLAISNPVEIFDALDTEERGLISIDEFCDGIWQVAISKSPIELKRMEKQMDAIRKQLCAVLDLKSMIEGIHKGFVSNDAQSSESVPQVPSSKATNLISILADKALADKQSGSAQQILNKAIVTDADSLKKALFREAEIIHSHLVEAISKARDELLVCACRSHKEAAAHRSGMQSDAPDWAKELTQELNHLLAGSIPHVANNTQGRPVVEQLDFNSSPWKTPCMEDNGIVACERIEMKAPLTPPTSDDKNRTPTCALDHSPPESAGWSSHRTSPWSNRVSETALLADSIDGFTLLQPVSLPSKPNPFETSRSPLGPPHSAQPQFPCLQYGVPPPISAPLHFPEAPPTQDPQPVDRNASRCSRASRDSGLSLPPDGAPPPEMHCSGGPTKLLAPPMV